MDWFGIKFNGYLMDYGLYGWYIYVDFAIRIQILKLDVGVFLLQ
jgi:hypothetical protein